MKGLEMHTKETKWQDAPLAIALRLREASDGWPIGYSEYRKAAATIEALVKTLEQKNQELNSMEPSE